MAHDGGLTANVGEEARGGSAAPGGIVMPRTALKPRESRIPAALTVLDGFSEAVVRMDSRSQLTFQEIGRARLGRDPAGNSSIAVGILAGGMATRYGPGVKAIEEIGKLSGRTRSFLEVKSAHTRWAAREYGRIVQVLMTSFHTEAAIVQDERAHAFYGLAPDALWHSIQPLVPSCYWRAPSAQMLRDEVEWRLATGPTDPSERRRLRERLAFWFERDGSPAGQASNRSEVLRTYHPAGSFEAIPALIRDGTLFRLLQNSVTYFSISNLDNFGATIEPALVGLLEASGKAAIVEGVERQPGDIGAWIGVGENQKAQFVDLRESGGRFHRAHPRFANISSWIIHLGRFMHELGLGEAELRDSSPRDLSRRVDELFAVVPWRNVIKAVPAALPGHGTQVLPVVQKERYLSDLALVISTLFVQTDRRKRYYPIKQRRDLARLVPRITALVEKQMLFADS